jgi:hypothetical protein
MKSHNADDKRYLKKLTRALDISDRRIKLDGCGDFNIFGTRGKISTDGEYWYLCVQRTLRTWNNVKKNLSFMEVHQDGDEEGVLRLARMPFRDEASLVRKTLGVRPRTVLTEEGRAALKIRLKTPSQQGVSSSQIDLNEVGGTYAA